MKEDDPLLEWNRINNENLEHVHQIALSYDFLAFVWYLFEFDTLMPSILQRRQKWLKQLAWTYKL
jgi:hypothetical protein